MCGIAGLIAAGARPRSLADAIIEMSIAIAHRGPDDHGYFVDNSCGVALGHRRLSVVDLSAEGHQPMASRSGRFVIVFNGEIYNFESLKAELSSIGHKFRGHSDTEVMLAAFEEWGIERATSRFAGMFAYAVWDKSDRRLWLVRDRFGKKPLYVFVHESVIAFASELKSVRRAPLFTGTVDRGALALYLRHNCVPGPKSIYRDVEKVQPGTMLVVGVEGGRPKILERLKYWDPRSVRDAGRRNLLATAEDVALDELETVLKSAVASRMVADVPLGAFLSGGVDSSLIVALMQSQSTRPVKTFTIGFEDAAFNEAPLAKEVAKHLGTDHTEAILTGRDALDRIAALPKIFDEPFADSSQIPMLLVSALARKSVTVALSGDGGDEVFGGYNRYILGRDMWRAFRILPHLIRRSAARRIRAVSPRRWDCIYGALSPFVPKRMRISRPGDQIAKFADVMGAESMGAFYRHLVSHWTAPAEIVLGAYEPENAYPIGDDLSLNDFTEEMMLIDAMTYLPDDILVKVDRASMSVSLEARAPLLDHRLFEFAARLPLHMKIRRGIGKWALRQVLYRYVPRRLIERPKVGFGIPLAAWLRGPLRPWAEELLSEQRLRREGFLSPAPIRAIWEEHLEGRREWQYLLWDVLMFQAWHEEAKAYG